MLLSLPNGQRLRLERRERLGTGVSLPIGSNAGRQAHWLSQESP